MSVFFFFGFQFYREKEYFANTPKIQSKTPEKIGACGWHRRINKIEQKLSVFKLFKTNYWIRHLDWIMIMRIRALLRPSLNMIITHA